MITRADWVNIRTALELARGAALDNVDQSAHDRRNVRRWERTLESVRDEIRRRDAADRRLRRAAVAALGNVVDGLEANKPELERVLNRQRRARA